jgi:hypothetical protein
MRRLQEGYDANDAIIARPQRTRFSPWNPVLQEHGNLQWFPQQGERRPRAPSPLPPTVEAYARNFTISAAHSRPKTVAHCNHNASTRKSLAPPETPPRHHQQAPNSPRPHHQGGAGSASPSKRSTTILPKSSLPAHSSRPWPATADHGQPRRARTGHSQATAGRSRPRPARTSHSRATANRSQPHQPRPAIVSGRPRPTSHDQARNSQGSQGSRPAALRPTTPASTGCNISMLAATPTHTHAPPSRGHRIRSGCRGEPSRRRRVSSRQAWMAAPSQNHRKRRNKPPATVLGVARVVGGAARESEGGGWGS